MKVIRALTSGLSLVLLTSCGGGSDTSGDGGGANYCLAHFLGGQVSKETISNCSGCSVQGDSAAIDDHGGTFAGVQFGPNGGSVTVRATAPLGTSFPSGTNAGALMQFPSGSFQNIGISFNTYLASVPVGLGSNGGEFTVNGNISGNGSDKYYSFSPNTEFDAIEAQISLSGNSSSEVVRLYEFCADR